MKKMTIAFVVIAGMFTNSTWSEIACGQSETKQAVRQDDKKPTKIRFVDPELQIVSRAMAMVQGNKPVIAELEILDYQVKQMQELQYEFRKESSEVSRDSAKLDRNGRIDAIEKLYATYDKKIGEILLPNQAKRLKQLAFQSVAIDDKTGTINIPRLLFLNGVRDKLEITPELSEKIRLKTAEENERIMKKMLELREESMQNILGVLSKEQRDKLDSMIGNPFDFEGYRMGQGGRFSKGGVGDDH